MGTMKDINAAQLSENISIHSVRQFTSSFAGSSTYTALAH